MPGTVIDFSTDETTVRIKKLDQLKGLFGQIDQCLKVVDPIAQAIDVVSFGEDDAVAHYLLRRCQGRSREQLKAIFARAMWMNMVPAHERETRLEQVASIVEARLQTLEQEEGLDAECELAAKFGVSVAAIRGIVADLDWMADDSDEAATFDVLVDAVIGTMLKDEQRLMAIVDPDSSDLAQIVGGAPTDGRWAPACLKVARDGLTAWMDGRPVCELDEMLIQMGLRKRRVPGLDLGRRFALQTAPALGGAASIVVQAVRTLVLADAGPSALASWMLLVPGCIREGFRDPDMLFISRELAARADYYPRVRIHEMLAVLGPHLTPTDPALGPHERRAQVRAALDAAGLRTE